MMMMMMILKAIRWPLIFILQIRFPPGISLATILKDHQQFFIDKGPNLRVVNLCGVSTKL